jgi:transcriptional regulator with XRE-family HTH domain
MNEPAKRQLAAMLRQQRKEAQLTQAALARRMGYVREYVTLAEAGRELPSAEFIARSGQVLGSADELLRLYRQAVAEREADRHTKDAEDDELRRRRFLAQMAGLAATANQLSPSDLFDAEPWERLARALEQPASLDTSVLATLEASIIGYRRQYATVPSGQLLAPVISRLHVASQLLERVHPDGLRAQLFSLAGQGAGLAGWLAFDLHDHATADKYYGVGLDAARRLADPWLEAYLLGAQSFLALYHGDVPTARQALDAAHDLAKRGSSRTTLAWIAAVQAEAYSLAGRERACLLALDESRRVVETARPDDPAADIFDAARLAGYQGACLVRLAQGEIAQPILRAAFGSLRPDLKRQRSNVLIDRAVAALQLGALDESCQLALRSAKLASVTRPAVAMQRLRQLRGQLEPWRDSQAVKDLDEQLWLL